MRYGIDVNENAVRFIKFTAGGTIKRVATASFKTEHELGSKEYRIVLTAAIKKAAKLAGASKGWGIPCTAVAGGPEVVIRRFTWPELPMAAVMENARSEFVPFLPGEPSEFTMSCEVLKRIKNEEYGSTNIEVLVAALPKKLTAAVIQAAAKAGFKVTRFEVRENARIKLINNCCIVDDGAPPESYAVLDLSQGRANMGIYLKGVFYSNRYFAANMAQEEKPLPAATEGLEDVDGDEIEDVEDIDDEANDLSKVYDPGTLATDVVSIIDYMQYRERGSSIACILLIGEDNLPGIEEALSESLDIPVFRADEWLKPGLARKVKVKRGQEVSLAAYLDIYGASYPAVNPKVALNLVERKPPGAGRKTVLPLVTAAGVLAAIVLGSAWFLDNEISDLQRELNRYNSTLARHTVDPATFAHVSQTTEAKDSDIAVINEFFTQWPDISDMMPIFLRPRVSPGVIISNFSITDGVGSFSGTVNDFNHLAALLEALDAEELIYSVVQTSAQDSDVTLPETVAFSIAVELEQGVGER